MEMKMIEKNKEEYEKLWIITVLKEILLWTKRVIKPKVIFVVEIGKSLWITMVSYEMRLIFFLEYEISYIQLLLWIINIIAKIVGICLFVYLGSLSVHMIFGIHSVPREIGDISIEEAI